MKILAPISILFRRYSVPIILLATIVLAYGWQIARLGFYWDDWVFVGRYQTLGVFNTIFYGDTRQLGVFALIPGFLLAGDSPMLWHIYSLLLRWIVALLFWWVLIKLWPEQKTSVTLMAALFAVHPAFSQQSISVVYSLQFFSYAIFLLSIGLMINAEHAAPRGGSETGTRSRLLWFGLAILAQAAHLFIVEYFVGLELIRPLVLYLLQNQESRWQRFKAAFIRWFPYLLILIVYAVWRSGVLGGGFENYGYKTITAFLRADPRAAITEIVEYGLKDILVLLVNTWQTTLAPSLVDLTQPYNFFSLIVAAASALGLYFILSRTDFDPDPRETSQDGRFLSQAVMLGLFAVVVGFIPSWFVRRYIVEPGNFGDRFALAGLFGASILLVALANFFAIARRRSILLVSIFIGLAIGAQIRFSNNYRWDWERQLRTYWQVYWRAPALKPGTVLVGYEAISSTTVNYVGAFSLNDLYLPARPASSWPIWYVNYPKTSIAPNLDKFLSGDWVYVDMYKHIADSVTVSRANSLGVDYGDGRCVKFLSLDDLVNYNLSDDFRPVARFSSPALIQSQSSLIPPQRIFGHAPPVNWCYYFQKGELARQFGEWDKVITLKKEADKAGFEPLNAYELFPFIEAYAMRADWADAQKLSAQAYKTLPKSQAGLCVIWKRAGLSAIDGYGAAFEQMNATLACH